MVALVSGKNYAFFIIKCIFAAVLVFYFQYFGSRIKGNQVRILNRPAAVSSSCFEHYFATVCKNGKAFKIE